MPIILPETSIATGNWPLSKMTLLSKESHVHFHGCFSRHVAGDFPITPPLELTWRHRWTKSVSYRGPEWNGPGKLESDARIRTNPRLHQLHSPNWKTCKKHVTCVHHMHVHVCSMHVYVYVHIFYIGLLASFLLPNLMQSTSLQFGWSWPSELTCSPGASDFQTASTP